MATINILGTGKPGTSITKDASDGTQLKVSSANGAFTVNDILLAADSSGSVKSLSSANNAVLLTNGSGTPTYSSSLLNGQMVIGSSTGQPQAASVTAGAGISITAGANSLTVTNTFNKAIVEVTTATYQAQVNSINIVRYGGGQCIVETPSNPALGDTVTIIGGSNDPWQLKMHTNQQLFIYNTNTTLGGTLTAHHKADAITIICIDPVAPQSWSPVSTCTDNKFTQIT